MKFLNYDVELGRGDIVEVSLSNQANVRLLDETNFERFRRGQRHTYRGGLAKRSPFRLAAPQAGHWHVVVDLGGYRGHVSASVRVHRST